MPKSNKHLPPSWMFQREHKEDIEHYLRQWPFEWLCHFTLKPEFDIYIGKFLFKKWRFKLINREKIRLACIRITGWKKRRPHFHVLCLGVNAAGKTLASCDHEFYAKSWTGGTAEIRVIDNLENATGYCADQFMGWRNDYAELSYYDRNLLDKTMTFPNPAYDFIGAVS